MAQKSTYIMVYRKKQIFYLWSEQTSHILDTQYVSSISDQLIRKFDVVIQVVLVPLLHSTVARVANRSLNNTSWLSSSFHSKDKIWQVVETVKNSENVHSVVVGELAEFANSIVRVICVADCVCSSKKHLKRNVWNLRSQLLQSLPRTFPQESQGNVKGRPAPALQRPEMLHFSSDERRTAQQISCSDSCGEERLMRVSHCCVCNEQSRVLTNSLGISFRSSGLQYVSPARRSGCWTEWFWMARDSRL